MEVTTVTVTRKRSKQPEQYGSAAAELTIVALVDAGEDWSTVAKSLLESTRALVYENLGLKLPASAGGKKADTPADTTEVSVETKTTDKGKGKTEPKKRGPGRPRKDTSDLPGVVDESDDDNTDADAPSGDETVGTEDTTPMNQSELQTQLVDWIKTKKIDISDARKIMVDIAGVVKANEVADDKVQEVYDKVKAALK